MAATPPGQHQNATADPTGPADRVGAAMFVIVSDHEPAAVGTRGAATFYRVKRGRRWIVRLALWLHGSRVRGKQL